MPFETVVLTAGGKPLPHSRCKLDASVEKAVREAGFTVAWSGAGLPCMPDDEATVTVSGELWGTGIIRDVRGNHDAESRRYDVTFVSRTVDAVEASIDHPTGLKRDADLVAIAKEFDTLGIGVEGTPKTLVKPVHKVIPGESLFETIETDARAQGVLIHDDERGRLVLADRPEGRHSGGLALGVNIKQASGQLSGEGNFSEVKARGQASDGVTASVLSPEAIAKGTCYRKRPLIVLNEGEVSSDRLKKRADWEARRGAGQGISATITVPGWRDQGGRLWTRNYLVPVDDDWLGIKQDMLIATASLDQDASGGTTATLTLKDPRALGGENPHGESADAWTAPATSEPEYRED